MGGEHDDGAVVISVAADAFDDETGQPIFEENSGNVIPFPQKKRRPAGTKDNDFGKRVTIKSGLTRKLDEILDAAAQEELDALDERFAQPFPNF
jgi:hypothetical protein